MGLEDEMSFFETGGILQTTLQTAFAVSFRRATICLNGWLNHQLVTSLELQDKSTQFAYLDVPGS